MAEHGAEFAKILLESGLVTTEQLEECRALQALRGRDLPTNLLEAVSLDEGRVLACWSQALGMAPIAPGRISFPSAAILAKLPIDKAVAWRVMPVEIREGALVLAVGEVVSSDTLELYEGVAGMPVDVRLTLDFRLRQALARAYGHPLDRRSERLLKRLGDAGVSSHSLRQAPPTRSEPSRSDRGSRSGRQRRTDAGAAMQLPTAVRKRRRGSLSKTELIAHLDGVQKTDDVYLTLLEFFRPRATYVALMTVAPPWLKGFGAYGEGASFKKVVEVQIPIPETGTIAAALREGRTIRSEGLAAPMDLEVQKLLHRSENQSLLVLPLGREGRVGAFVYMVAPTETLAEVQWAVDAASHALTRLGPLESLRPSRPSLSKGLAPSSRGGSSGTKGPSLGYRTGRPAGLILPSASPPPLREERSAVIEDTTLPKGSVPQELSPREPSSSFASVDVEGPSTLQEPETSQVEASLPPPSSARDAPTAVSFPPRRVPSSRGNTESFLPSVLVEADDDVLEQVRRLVRQEEDSSLEWELGLRGHHLLPVLCDQFPGPIASRMDREEDTFARPKQAGPIVRLVLAQGVAAVPFICELAQSERLEARYWAVAVLGNIGHADAIAALLVRLDDDDASVRRAARWAIGRVANRRVEDVVAALARAAGDGDLPLRKRLAMMEGLANTGSREAVHALIEMLDSSPDLKPEVVGALAKLTRHDCGDSSHAWSEWWQRHGHAHRFEWLLHALGNPREDLRHEALLELRRESRLHVEPTARMPKNEVARLQQRYTDWWVSEGRYTLRETEGFEWAP